MKKELKYLVIVIIIIALLIGVSISKNKDEIQEENIVNEIQNNMVTDTTVSVINAADNQNNNLKYDVTFSTEYFSSYNEKNERVCSSERNIPTIVNPNNPDSAKVIESDLRTIMDDFWENDIKVTSEEVKVRDADEDILGVKYFVNLEYQSDNVITFSIKLDGDFGGVSWNQYELYSYDAQTGELLTLNNVSTNSESLKVLLGERTKEQAKANQIQIDDTEKIGVDILLVEKMQSHGSFGILGDGIHINYHKYDIATGAAGVIEVKLEKDTANQYLLEKYNID